ncbi:MAG: hypothetical protein KJ077_11225 [Anaerolineae bacterium]|nr:hypothetical protein [Anaerolineae bacterium]
MNDYLGRTIAPTTLQMIDDQLAGDKWYEQDLDPAVTGLPRPVRVIRGPRTRKTMLTFDWHGDNHTFCPPKWWDLAIGAGACGYGCRSCFLMLTHRAMNDPMRHRLYDNVADYPVVVAEWLKATEWPHPNPGSSRDPQQRSKKVKLDRFTTLGLGIDRSDSLLYEGVTGHARRLIPLFINPETNPQGRQLILLTKSANTHYLNWRRPDEEFPGFGPACSDGVERYGQIPNVSVTFSLNPEEVADKWEGKYPDTLERITPPIADRLEAARFAQQLGFDVRWRLDPILPIPQWAVIYHRWLMEAVDKFDAQPSWITLGTYREKNDQLDFWRGRWGLPPMEYEPEGLVHDGTHFHLSQEARQEIYGLVRDLIIDVWKSRGLPVPAVSLCKESNTIRRALSLCNATCNCL